MHFGTYTLSSCVFNLSDVSSKTGNWTSISEIIQFLEKLINKEKNKKICEFLRDTSTKSMWTFLHIEFVLKINLLWRWSPWWFLSDHLFFIISIFYLVALCGKKLVYAARVKFRLSILRIAIRFFNNHPNKFVRNKTLVLFYGNPRKVFDLFLMI